MSYSHTSMLNALEEYRNGIRGYMAWQQEALRKEKKKIRKEEEIGLASDIAWVFSAVPLADGIAAALRPLSRDAAERAMADRALIEREYAERNQILRESNEVQRRQGEALDRIGTKTLAAVQADKGVRKALGYIYANIAEKRDCEVAVAKKCDEVKFGHNGLTGEQVKGAAAEIVALTERKKHLVKDALALGDALGDAIKKSTGEALDAASVAVLQGELIQREQFTFDYFQQKKHRQKFPPSPPMPEPENALPGLPAPRLPAAAIKSAAR